MKKIVNNLLYGQTSQYLAGRFDSDIYAQGCSKLENFDVMLQGGIKRRPPRRILLANLLSSATKVITYTIDTTNTFLVVLNAPTQSSSGSITIVDCTNIQSPVYVNTDYPSEGGVDTSFGWSSLTASQLDKVKSVVYYNDLLMVHPDVPILRIHYEGGAFSTAFSVQIPKLVINQDSVYWENEAISYGKDDFKEMKLNDGPNHYASQIAVISERLYLGCTNAEPYKIWASSVADSSQEVKTSENPSDSLFDFIQFRVVESQNTEVDTSKLPVKKDGENYLGNAYAQQMWDLRNQDPIEYQSDYEERKLDCSLRVEMVGGTVEIDKISKRNANSWREYIINFDYDNLTAELVSGGTVNLELDEVSQRVLKISANNVVYAEAIPVYITDMASLNDMISINTELSQTATDSTSMEFQLASGRNDKVTLIGTGDYIFAGTESSLWRMNNSITALDFSADMYGSFGSPTGLHTNISTDLVILERGNKARLFYKDYYGLQTINLSLTCPEILEGTIKEIVCKETDTPQVYFLKNKNGVNSIVCLSLDRANGIQGWAEWTFASGTFISLGIIENSDKQYLAGLVNEDNQRYLAYFDTNESSVFCDCSFVDGTLADNQKQYTSEMITNPFEAETDNGTTFGEDKIIDRVIFRAKDTGRIITQTNEDIPNITRFKVADNCVGDFEININGGSSKEIEVSIKSFESDPLNLLCMAYDVRLVNG